MAIECKNGPINISSKCPYSLEQRNPVEIPDDITAVLRPATEQEVKDHQAALDSRSYLTQFTESVRDIIDRILNTIGPLFYTICGSKVDYRAYLKRTIADNPYLSVHKVYGQDIYTSRHPVIIKALLKDYHNDNAGDACYHLKYDDHGEIEMLKEIFDDDEITGDDFILSALKKPTEQYLKFLRKFFAPPKMKNWVPAISSLVDCTIDDWSKSESRRVNVTKETKNFSSSVISALFLNYEGPYKELCEAIENVLICWGACAFQQTLSKKFLNELRQQHFPLLRSTVENAIKQAREFPDGNSCINTMINNGFSDRQIKVMTLTLFGAGQENTASAINYVILKCAQDSNLQEGVRKELEKIIDQKSCSVAEAAIKSGKIKQIIVEGLRMVTPAYTAGRVTDKDLVLEITHTKTGEMDKRFIHSSNPVRWSRILPLMTFAARHSSVVPEDPDKFVPDRYSPDDIPDSLSNLAWSPFGSGADTCPGWCLAYYEEMIFLGTLLYNYEIQTNTVGEPKLVAMFSCTTADDVYITLRKIKMNKREEISDSR